MKNPLQIKICGLTRKEDVALASSLGADFLGFIVYPQSPRGLSLDRAVELAAEISPEKRVIVDVEPTLEDLERYRDAGFAAFQLHARGDIRMSTLEAWSGVVGRERLWFAPRMKPGEQFDGAQLNCTDTILVDSYSGSQVGGTGKTGDWVRFRALREAYPQVRWILAGGLSSNNIEEALEATGSYLVDINSGIESAPGIKDDARMQALFRILRP
ncbi:MAG: phosphoribosylanthranilate isomerase [Coraliomargaritaceae bacterium]